MNNSMKLENKVVLLTGAASGIGAKTAWELASQGATLVLSDISENGLELAEEINQRFPGNARFVKTNVCESIEVQNLVQNVMDNEGHIDCLVNNAGVDHPLAPLAQCEDEWLDKVLNINVKGVFYGMKYGLLAMLQKGGGVIINIASIAGVTGAPAFAPYAASKHAVVGLTKSAALEYGAHNIRINAVCPGFVRTPMYERAAVSEDMERKLLGRVPMKRPGEPQEIANAIAWLCSDEPSFMNGHCMVLDGGHTA